MGISVPNNVRDEMERERREKIVKHALLGELMPIMIDLTRLVTEIRHIRNKDGDDAPHPHMKDDVLNKIDSLVELFFTTYTDFMKTYINDIDGLARSALERMMQESMTMGPGPRIPRE